MNTLYIANLFNNVDINDIYDYIIYVVKECNIKNIVWNNEKKIDILMQQLMKIYEKEQILFSCIIQKEKIINMYIIHLYYIMNYN